MSRPRSWRWNRRARAVQQLAVLGLALALPACAIQPNGLDDPIGAKAAFGRCFGPNYVRQEDRIFPNWFSMFGPALACR